MSKFISIQYHEQEEFRSNKNEIELSKWPPIWYWCIYIIPKFQRIFLIFLYKINFLAPISWNKFIFFYLNMEMATLAERIVLNDRSERKKCRRTTPCFHELQQQQWYTEGSQTPVVFIFVKKLSFALYMSSRLPYQNGSGRVDARTER